MKTSKLLSLAVVAAAFAPLAATANTEVFANGRSFFGQSAQVTQATRQVDLSQAPHVNVRYGETVAFRGANGEQFAWTFNGLDRRSVDVQKIAPAGFAADGARVYIDRDPSNRN